MLKDLHNTKDYTKLRKRAQNLRKMTKGNPLTPHKKSVPKQAYIIIMRTNNHGLINGQNVYHVLTQGLFKP